LVRTILSLIFQFLASKKILHKLHQTLLVRIKETKTVSLKVEEAEEVDHSSQEEDSNKITQVEEAINRTILAGEGTQAVALSHHVLLLQLEPV
jgi:hypothetical protein